ncbi:hypothetical protein A3860_32750 [Niastella vici]|uniref:Uncharacterized protein n=1 Tax=Niastella vici TaxID=1703345 RepID=A0A1V9FQQ9_9BACT|nr:hypothetical protein [Niastella vici]OQP60586.1 hypothetical protein A3860_32750 [Niastella vici]
MTIYKILCEVKWLHEYYCTLEKGETIFEKAAQQDRMNFLFDRFVKDLPSIHEDLEFVAHSTNNTFPDHYVRVLPAYAGFKLAVQCRKEKLMDGTIVYRPFVNLPNELCLRIMVRPKKNISRYSAEISPGPLQPLWYFSSNDLTAARTFPFLTAPIPAFVNTQSYVQSELALHAGIAKSFLNNGAIDPWLTLPGTQYINTNDALLLPLTFVYTFNELDNITNASFILKDSTSTIVQQLDLASPKPMQNVTVDFHTNKEIVKAISYQAVTPDQLYKLEVTGSGGYSKTFNNLLFAHDAIEPASCIGVIDLVIKPANASFDLLDASGYLFTRISPGGIKQPAPIFELWMKSKSAYWQYSNNRQKKFKLTPATTDLLNDNSGVLVSKNPVPMSYTPVKLKKPDNSFQLLPNPDPDMEVRRDGNKITLNMQVPQSNLFPLV